MYRHRLLRSNFPEQHESGSALYGVRNPTTSTHSPALVSDQPQTTILDLLDPKQHYPVYDTLCRHLEIVDIINLTRTCKALSGIYQDLQRTHWNLNNRLNNFVKDPIEFRSLLRQSGGVIMGFFVRSFFTRSSVPSILHMYVHPEWLDRISMVVRGKPHLRDYLVAQSIELNVREFRIDRPGKKILQVVIMTKVDFDIIRALAWVYKTTDLMTIMTWDRAYNLFPLSTFVHHTYYLVGENSMADNFHTPHWHDEHLQRYQVEVYGRGLTRDDQVRPEHQTEKQPVRFHRRIGDALTWVIKMNIHGISTDTEEAFLSKTLEIVTFNMRGCIPMPGIAPPPPMIGARILSVTDQAALDTLRCPIVYFEQPEYAFTITPHLMQCCRVLQGRERKGYLMMVNNRDIVRNYSLKGQYTAAKYHWGEFLAGKSAGATMRQLKGLRPEQIPPELGNLDTIDLRDLQAKLQAAGFVVPENWEYYDDQVVLWYKQWLSVWGRVTRWLLP
ncbi:hypothetical protein K490DRAFT_61177 [Saccharata proteae CBS 121410]|uniref:F-box domain-containing protein n=1 Tax=Saccharata proteae CBS 121410 TaxID=1314787 RepID=A0A9P4I2D0_9PEZI|nr:hypothetical protein K490DRAFT_61177 [Saccharata proteae CBS 121410]